MEISAKTFNKLDVAKNRPLPDPHVLLNTNPIQRKDDGEKCVTSLNAYPTTCSTSILHLVRRHIYVIKVGYIPVGDRY